MMDSPTARHYLPRDFQPLNFPSESYLDRHEL
jgi:hypothetical protein